MSSYWNHQGRYQKEYEEFSKLIPASGACQDFYLEALRLMCNWYYEIFNNGRRNRPKDSFLRMLRQIGIKPHHYNLVARRTNPDLDRLVDAILEKLIERRESVAMAGVV